MPVLDNPRWERVAQLIARGETQGEAYFRVYRPETRATARSACSALVTKPDVSDRIRELTEKFAKRYEITTDNITRELARIAFSNSADYLKVNEEGDSATIDLADLDHTKGAAIAEFTEVRRTIRRGRGEDAEVEEIRENKIKVASPGDKTRALELLGKQQGMFKQQTEFSGPGGGPIEQVARYGGMTDDQLLQLEALLTGRAEKND